MEQQLLSYEHEMYRLDQAEHFAGRLDRVELCEEILGVVPGPEDRQSQTKWTVKLTWFHNTICRELEQDAIEEWLMRYTRGYIMQLIGGILFPDASDSRVYIRWLPLLEDLDACGRLSWGSAVLAWLYRHMFRATDHGQRNMGGCVSLMLSWAYHHILLVWPDGYDARRFPLVERWVQYWSDNATDESRLRQYRHTMNGIGMLNVEGTPYADPQLVGLVPPAIAEADPLAAVICPLLCSAIVEWHQVDRVVRQFNGLQHLPTRPLNIDDMHRLDGRLGCGEWFPHLLGAWHEMWDARADHRLPIYHHIDLCPSLPYMTWYLQWAHTELFGLGDQHLVPAGVVPEDLPIHHPVAPDLHQPVDGHLLELRPAAEEGEVGDGGEARGEADAAKAVGGRIPRRFLARETLSARQLTVPTMQARRWDHCQDPCQVTTCL
ncbi:hypothetical protein Ahy_B07g086248 [Arachis hypogaea]|uniref:Aminotransferase-like plant mobile domain-containing protein n=1 Tax=Arachis hypogaea TaxID=3818 RepID=A0A444Y9B4_ARAHY|nr:hypothetical protein Ahy_B07g086248 [Arachis hypogaea]